MPTLQPSDQRSYSQRRLVLEVLESRLTPTRAWFESSDLPLHINGSTSLQAEVVVNRSVTIQDIDIWLNLDHAKPDELDLTLISPAGTEIRLITGRGGNGTGFHDTIIDDQAQESLNSTTIISGQRYRPEESLATLENEQAQGAWHLRIQDNNPMQNHGTIYSFRLGFTSAPDDHGDSIAIASPLIQSSSSFFSESGNIETIGDHDWFSWTASENGSIKVQMTANGSTIRPGLDLYDIYNNELIPKQSGSDSSSSFFITFDIKSGATYFIDTSFSMNRCGTFGLTLQFSPDDHGSKREYSTPLTQTSENTWSSSGKLEIDGDHDWFKWTATATGLTSITMTMLTKSGNISEGTITAVNGSGIILDQSISPLSGQESVLIIPVFKNTIYYLDLHSSNSGTGTYSIALSYADPIEQEPAKNNLYQIKSWHEITKHIITIPGPGHYLIHAQPVTAKTTEDEFAFLRMTLDTSSVSLFNNVISNYRGDTPGSRLTGSLLEFEAHKAGNATLFLYESNLWTGFYELFIREELTDKSVIDVSTSNLEQSRRAGEIELQGDKDVFEFTNHDFFDIKTILVSVSSAIDSQLMPSLSLTNDFSDQSNPPKSMILTIPPSAASSVYVTASDAFGLGSTGAYQLTYQEITDDIPANLVKPIVLNQSSTSETASFDFENDADSFSFVSLKKASYRISISSLNDDKLEFESSVERVDKTTSTPLARLTEFNNSAIVGLDEYETVSIKVISHESIGSYIVDIAIIPDFDPITDSIPGNMNTRAISKISGSQSSFLGTIETAGDSDWIKLDVEKSGQYTIQLLKNGESGLADPHLAIRDSDGKILIADDDSGGDRNSKLLIVLDAEKTYYADVTGFNLTIGSYILNASMIADSGNASVDIGDVLSSNFRSIINPESGNLESSIDAPYDRDAYLFTPDRSGKLSVSLKSTSGLDTVLEVVSANTKQTLAINDNHGLTSDSRIEYSVTSGEKIYLVAYGFGKSIGSYKISWQIANVTNTQADDPPSSIATFANLIPSDYDINTRTNPFILNGDIDTNSDIDLFRWTPDEDATASVSLSSIGSSHLDPALRIIDSTGKTIIRNDDGGEGLDSLIRNFHFQSGKSYFIECSSSGNQSTGKYQLQLAIQTRSKRVEFLPLVDEAPNTPELSTPMIQFDGSFGCVVGNIRNTSTGPLPDLSSYNSDIDTYQVKMPAAGGAIDIRVGRAELPGSPSGSLQPSLIVLDGSMQVTHRFSWNGNGTVEPVWTISATANSTFYLQISGQNQSGGGYRISLARKSDDVSNGVAYGTVPILAIGRPPEPFAIEYAGDLDAFQIQTLNSQRLRFEVIVIDLDKHDKIRSDAVVKITDSNGVELARTGSHNNGSSLSIEIDTIPRQSLYAIISGYGTDNPIYSIRVASMTRIPGDEAGDSIVLARQLTRMPNQIGQIYTTSTNDEYEPAIQSPDDIDFWSFTAQTTGQYNVHIDKSNISYAAVLRSYREEDSAHAGNYVPDADGNIDFQFNARAGEEIYIKVAGWSIADSLLGSKFINGNHYSLAVKFIKNTDHAFTTSDILRQLGAVLDDSFGSKYLELLRVSSTLKNARSAIDSINSDLISILQDISTDTVTPIFCLWLDPIDFIVSNAKGQMVGSIEQVGNINQIASAGISNRGNLDLVVIANPDINALNISLYGIGGGRVLGGASFVKPGNNLEVLVSRIDIQNIGKEGSENNKIQLELIFDKRIDPEKPRITEKMIPTNLSIIVKLDMTKFDPTLLTTFFAASLNAVASIIPAHDEIGSGVSVSDGFSEPTQLLASISGSKSDENEFWPLLGLRAVQFVITPVTATMTKLAESIFIIPGAPIVTHLAEKIVSPAANALTSAAHAVIYVISESQLIREWGKWHKITIQPSLNQTIKSVASMLPPVRQIDLFPSSNHNPIVIPSNPVIAPATAQSPKTPSFNPGAMIIAVGWGFAIRWDRKKRQGRVRQVARIYFS